jgi:hypothetical protein
MRQPHRQNWLYGIGEFCSRVITIAVDGIKRCFKRSTVESRELFLAVAEEEKTLAKTKVYRGYLAFKIIKPFVTRSYPTILVNAILWGGIVAINRYSPNLPANSSRLISIQTLLYALRFVEDSSSAFFGILGLMLTHLLAKKQSLAQNNEIRALIFLFIQSVPTLYRWQSEFVIDENELLVVSVFRSTSCK